MPLWCMGLGWLLLPDSQIPSDEPLEKETNMNGIKPDQLPVGHQLRNALEQAAQAANQDQPKGLLGLQAFTPNPAVSPDLFTADAVAAANKALSNAFATTIIDVQSIHFDQCDDGIAQVTAKLTFKGKTEIPTPMRHIVGGTYVRSLVNRMGRDPQKCTYQIDCDNWIPT